MFVATLVYETDDATSKEARKLLRAELVGRRYNDHFEGKRMPEGCLWIRRSAEPHETVDDLKRKCQEELRSAVAAVSARGLPVRVSRVWLQVSGAGTFGLAENL